MLPGEEVCTEAQGPRGPAQATQPVRTLLGQELNEVLLPPSGLSQLATLWSHETDRPSFVLGTELLKSKLCITPKTPGAGPSAQPDPAQRGYWLVLPATAAPRSRAQELPRGFSSVLGASLSLACVTPGARTSTSGPSQPFCSFSRSLQTGRERKEAMEPRLPAQEAFAQKKAITGTVRNSARSV